MGSFTEFGPDVSFSFLFFKDYFLISFSFAIFLSLSHYVSSYVVK